MQRLEEGLVGPEGTVAFAGLEFSNALRDTTIDNRLRLENNLAVLGASFEYVAHLDPDLVAHTLRYHHLKFVLDGYDGHKDNS